MSITYFPSREDAKTAKRVFEGAMDNRDGNVAFACARIRRAARMRTGVDERDWSLVKALAAGIDD